MTRSAARARSTRGVAGLADRLATALRVRNADLPVYWGNRNWHPYLADTVAGMNADGIRHALAFVTSAYSSYSSCRQYLENLDDAVQRSAADNLAIEKLRPFFDHPGFVDPMADGLREAFSRGAALDRSAVDVVFTAHSLPESMARGSSYQRQLDETARLVAERAGVGDIRRHVVFQSRSGPPQVPWLGPDINDHLVSTRDQGVTTVIVVPIGFVADHMEVVHDLDTVARATAESIGLEMRRVATAGDDPRFVDLAVDLVLERLDGSPRRSLGRLGLWPDRCAGDCCPAPVRPVPGNGGADLSRRPAGA